MFSLNPYYITFAINEVAMAIKGKTARITSEKLHPLVNAKVIPATHRANAKIIVPIFSPRAFYIAKHSLPIRADNSDGLLLSNHALSYLRIASKYAILIVFIILSLVIVKNE